MTFLCDNLPSSQGKADGGEQKDETQNPGIVWIGRNLKDSLIPTPLPKAGTSCRVFGKTREQLLLLVFVKAFSAKGWEEFGVQGD